MNMPGFTAEQALRNASRKYIASGSSDFPRYDSVFPQWDCKDNICSCYGFEDCRRMRYVSSICWLPSFSCYWGWAGPNCTCTPAIA